VKRMSVSRPKTASVFYRNARATEFKPTEMMRKLGTDDYSATLAEAMEPGVEYYNPGNRSGRK